MLFKREILEYLFPFTKIIYFDAYIAANAAALNGVHYYDDCLVQYRQHVSNTLSGYAKKKLKKQKSSIVEKKHLK